MLKQPSALTSQMTGTELFRLLVDRVQDYAIYGLDQHGIVVSWNAGAERIKGYRAEEIIGHHFSRFYPEEAIRSGWPQTELQRAAREGRFEDEGWRVRKNGSRFWANVVLTAIHDDEGNLCGYAKITRDLSDRKRMERLEADARQISEFVAMLAHELRNPLGPIRNAIALAKQLQDPERVRSALEVIDRQSTHLTRLVDDLLDMSRITKGQIRLDLRRLLLSEVVDRALEALRSQCEQRGLNVTVHQEGDAVIRGDLVRLTQVLSNLLSNACKYTPTDGRIDIVIDANETEASVAVRDTGVGIAPELLPRLFDIFTQEERSLARSEGGLGLGLAISRRLTEMHNGTLTAASPGPGCGSEFILRLPTLRAISQDESRPHGHLAALSVLVVDDNRDAAQMLAALLDAHGHQTAIAYDGMEAVQVARRELPDLVLLDIGLPGMDGYEVARALRNEPSLQGIFLVAVTGYGSQSDRNRAMEAGFDVHLSKPIDFDTLQRRVPILAAT